MANENKKTKGEISVTTEHIFPIIKRWLYSDKEIFLRELVSNASDAITKLSRLVSLSEATLEKEEAFRIDVTLDAEAGTLCVSDNGIGMTAEEIDRYINQIALSGALEFIEKYEGETENGGGIIGHFGLGFYSAFMVADRVDLETRSYTGADAVFWSCDESGAYHTSASERKERGTTVTLHVTDDEREYLTRAAVERVLKKYCGFLSTPIYLTVAGEEAANPEVSINDVDPLWQRAPGEITDEEYNAFYHKLFSDPADPLFYIHLNADYPLNFKGILYFPRLKNEFQSMEGEVKLFYNRVFVADNISEVVPEYLLSLKGVLDCPELPLNVSRSFLQSSPYVSKVSAHIVKKVCDKITSLFSADRKGFEAIFSDLKPFLEYGSMKDEKFYTRIADVLLFATTEKEFLTLPEYLERSGDKTVYYTTDAERQSRFVDRLREAEKTVVVLDSILDTQFVSFLETKREGVHFSRVDSDLSGLSEEGDVAEDSELKAMFESVLPEGVTLAWKRLKNAETPAVLTSPEEARRFADMMKLYRMQGLEGAESLPRNEILTLNLACPILEKLKRLPEELRGPAATQIYLGALLEARSPDREELKRFSENNNAILSALSKDC